MDSACSRKRSMPKIITNRPEKRRVVTIPPPLLTPEPQDGDVDLTAVSDWSDALEKEIERKMETLPKPSLPGIELLTEDMPKEAEKKGSSAEVHEEVKVVEKEPEVAKVGYCPITEAISDADDDALSTISSDENFSDVEEPEKIPEPYVPEPTCSADPSYEPLEAYKASPIHRVPTKEKTEATNTFKLDPARHKPSPMLHYAPYRPIVEDRSYQQQHRQHWRKEKAEPATAPKNCHWWVKEVLPYRVDYLAVRVVGLEKKQREQRQNFGVFMTEHIPYGSPYWSEVIERAGTDENTFSGSMRSSYDDVRINFIKYRGGKIKATRNYTSVIIREKLEVPQQQPIKAVHKDKTRVKKKYVFPTEQIPINSRYYSELTYELFFPRDKSRWVHVLARDAVPVHFRLGLKGESLIVNRNGVTVQLFGQ